MSGIQHENKTVNETAARTPIAGEVLHHYHIDPSSLPLSQAAALTSSTPDEVLALIEAKMRREARYTKNGK